MANAKENTYECFGGGPADGQKIPGDGGINSIMLRLDPVTDEMHLYRFRPGKAGSARPEPHFQYEGDDVHALMARMLEENHDVFTEE